MINDAEARTIITLCTLVSGTAGSMIGGLICDSLPGFFIGESIMVAISLSILVSMYLHSKVRNR